MDIKSICAIHDVLMRDTHETLGLRNEQVWIGGSPYSPHGATFVPPHAGRVQECLEDLVIFGTREDIPSIAKAAVFHAQFETIHPFTDGNGRTGRTLLHRMLARDEVLIHTMLPVSAGLLHDIKRYMDALDAYHRGAVEPMIECLIDALELSVVIGSRIASDIDESLPVGHQQIRIVLVLRRIDCPFFSLSSRWSMSLMSHYTSASLIGRLAI